MARLHCSLPIHFFLKFTFPVSILYGKNMVWYHITSPCPGQNWHCCLWALFIFSLPPSHLITSLEFLQFKPLKHHHLHNRLNPWKPLPPIWDDFFRKGRRGGGLFPIQKMSLQFLGPRGPLRVPSFARSPVRKKNLNHR